MVSKFLFFIFLFLSGFSSLINQVVWQRAIKIYLGGADAICSMIVVFVFMLGLGVGSLLISKKTSYLKKPLLTLSILELSLFITNLIVLFILKLEISDSVFAIQKTALASGLSMKFLYAVTGFLLLIVPCSLMGMTMPVASEIAKRQLQIENVWVLDNMFFINTIGSCLGAVLTGYKLLPYYGQTICLIIAASMNVFSAGLCLFINRKTQVKTEENKDIIKEDKEENNTEQETTKSLLSFKTEEIAAFFMGFVSLGYEMYLTRTIPLIYEPLPYIFSAILTLYLLFWAIGVSLAGIIKERIKTCILFCSVIIWISPFIVQNHRNGDFDLTVFPTTLIYVLPCLLFGIIYGQLLNKQLKNWGHDVGLFMGLNTIGSCLGILLTTMVGGYMFFAYNAWIFASLLFLVVLWLELKDFNSAFIKKYYQLIVACCFCFVLLPIIYMGTINPVIESERNCYMDPVGVTEITKDGNMIWDGLWHSQLTDGKRHIKHNNWVLAVVPFLAMPDEENTNALNIGMGIGITASVLSKSDLIKKVKTYEINKSIDLILSDFATATLNIRTNPKIEIIWQDARTGLSLNEENYTIITQQPLYLKQAGSSNLLSEEYLRTVSKRLKDNGIFLVYANCIGNEAQKMLVEKTLRKVFPYCVSFLNRYMYLVSKSPIIYTKESIQNKFNKYSDDELMKEIKTYCTVDQLYYLRDSENDIWKKCPLTITDDCPILEYPNELTKMSKNWH